MLPQYANTAFQIQRDSIESLVRQIVRRSLADKNSSFPSPREEKSEATWSPNLRVSISARHVHLTDEHVELLFGKDIA